MRAVAVPHGLMPQGPLAVLLAEHLRNLVACLEASPDIDGLALAEATASLVAAVVTNSPAALEVARPHVHAALRRRILRYVDLNLENPDLTQDHLCGVFHLSRTSLYRLFRDLAGRGGHSRHRGRSHRDMVHGLLSPPEAEAMPSGPRRRGRMGRPALSSRRRSGPGPS